MAVLITGGAGYIGSHTALTLLEAGREILIADNFCNASEKVPARLAALAGRDIPLVEIDLTDEEKTDRLFFDHSIDSVIHFAALKAVGESAEKPLAYYRNNLVSTLSVLRAMERHGCRNFVFSSSATVYGEPQSTPITEDFPLSATNPYGQTKLMIEHMLRDLFAANKTWNIALLRYFNPIGAHPSGLIGEDPSGIPNNLLPYITQVAVGKLPQLSVFGNDYPTPDGTGVRDYIHVMDLARGHLLALEKLETDAGLVTYNLGTGKGYSVLEIVEAFQKASGQNIPYVMRPRRKGDIAASFADPSLAKKELGWEAHYSLEDMCAHSWNWQKKNPHGYH